MPAIFSPYWCLVTIFIILRVWSNCFMRRFTSRMFVPLPFAIRIRRLWLRISGWHVPSASCSLLWPQFPLNALSSISTSFMALPTPGIIAARSLRLPIFFICSICPRKSLKSNLFFCIFFCRRRASSSSNCSCAFYKAHDVAHSEYSVGHA